VVDHEPTRFPTRLEWGAPIPRESVSVYGLLEIYSALGRLEMRTEIWLEGKRSLGRHRPRREDSIKMDRREIMSDGVDWIHLASDRDRWRALVNKVMNLLLP
jgi:hypothetical protein